jgi:hypothetical protein
MPAASLPREPQVRRQLRIAEVKTTSARSLGHPCHPNTVKRTTGFSSFSWLPTERHDAQIAQLSPNRYESLFHYPGITFARPRSIGRSDVLQNILKRLLIKSHYLFVANAAVRSYIGGGFRGLNGSQASEILSLLITYLPSAKFSGPWAEVSSLVLTLRPGVLKRRVFHSAPKDSDTRSADHARRSTHRNRAGTVPSIAASGRPPWSESGIALQT